MQCSSIKPTILPLESKFKLMNPQRSLYDKIMMTSPTSAFFVIFCKKWLVPNISDESRTQLEELQVSLNIHLLLFFIMVRIGSSI